MVETAPGMPRYCRHVGVVHDGLPFLRRTVSYSREEHRDRREQHVRQSRLHHRALRSVSGKFNLIIVKINYRQIVKRILVYPALGLKSL